jgi:tetratricopeptide (TPR) repeat protein
MMASHRPSDPPPPDPEAPPPTPAAPPAGLKPSGFVIGFDWVLAFGVLVLAFFAGSFSVRNSDFWMHLAAGRLIAGGEYSFGTDPFSYATEGRYYANHEWLYDWGLYQLFKAGAGQAVVIAKCLALALAAGLLLLTRRPGQSAFPIVVCTGLAFVAAAPRLLLQPHVASVLLLAGLLYALMRVPKPAGSWTFPVVIGVLFAVWSNTDQWFFLGPVFLALYAAGQFVRRDEETDPVTVLKALGIGVIACCLNPHHIHVWELPGELAGGTLEKVFADDQELGILFRGGLDKSNWDFDANPATPLAQIGLFALSVVGFALNYRHLSVGLALVWAAAVALGAWHLRAVPFFAVVVAPIAATNLAQAAARLASRPIPEGTARALETAQTTGRFLAGLTGALLIAISYAGWLHPAVQQRRWKWDVEPIVSNQRAAEQIHRWRQDKALPPEARVLNIQPDMANYIAWFAPGQRTYFDTRLGFMAPEAEDFAAVRRRLAPRAEAGQDSFDFSAFLRKHEVVYAVTAHQHRLANQHALDVLWRGGRESEWALWAVAGRAVLLGWDPQRAVPKAAVAGLRFDPVRAAFVNPPAVPEPPPAAEMHPPFRPADVWDRYVAAPPTVPADGEEVLVYEKYLEGRIQEAMGRHQRLLAQPIELLARMYHTSPTDPSKGRWVNAWAPNLVNALATAGRFHLPAKFPPEVYGVSLLSVRSGRRAVVAIPDHPDGYFLLATAYQAVGNQMPPVLRTAVTTANLARCFARLPADPANRGGMVIDAGNAAAACQFLFGLHMEATPPRFDAAVECRRVLVAYLRASIDDADSLAGRVTDDAVRARLDREVTGRRAELAELTKSLEEAEKGLKGQGDVYVNAVASRTAPRERGAVARSNGLVLTAIEELEKAHQQYEKRLANEAERNRMTPADQAEYAAVHAELIELMLYTGRAEEAAALLDGLDTPENRAVLRSDAVRQQYAVVRQKAFRAMFRSQQVPLTPYDLDPVGQLRSLRQAVSLSMGHFDAVAASQLDEAQQVRTELDSYVRRTYPTGVPPLTAADLDDHPDDLAFPLNLPVDPFRTAASYFRVQAREKARQYVGLLRKRYDAHARLGLTYLEMGRMKDAIYHLEQAVAGAEPPVAVATRQIARTCLEAIAPVRAEIK